MKRVLRPRFVLFAGMVCLPMALTPKYAQSIPSRDYSDDPRFERLRKFFAKFDCPAWKYAGTFLEAADDYELDWRLLPSLSYVESTGGKAALHNNLFGWDSGRAQFSSPHAAIHTVGYRLAYANQYRDKNLDQVLNTYNPNADYAAIVKSVMRRISPAE